MPSEQIKFSATLIKKALAQVGLGEHTYSETQVPGLALRVRTSSATWCLRGRLGLKQTTWRIGDVAMMKDLTQVRNAANEARILLQRGIDPEDRLREIKLNGPVEVHHDPARDGWTWETARDKYLEHVKNDKAAATYVDYRSTLRSPDLDPLKGLLVKQITDQRAKRIQDAIYERGKLTQARHVTHILKACLGWVATKADTGISVSPIASVRPLAASLKTKVKGYVPTEVELGRLPWRLEGAAIASRSRLAGLLLMLTAQRIETVSSARKEHFKPVGENRGLWDIPAAHMKSKRDHILPLPPATWDIVRQAMALTEEPDGWLFPQVRPRRKGGPCDGHITYHAVAEPLSPLNPHDFRRAFATHGQNRLGMKPSDSKAILDHAEGNSGDVTQTLYALHDGTHFKWDLMKAWEAYLLRLAVTHCPQPGARLRTMLLPESRSPSGKRKAKA